MILNYHLTNSKICAKENFIHFLRLFFVTKIHLDITDMIKWLQNKKFEIQKKQFGWITTSWSVQNRLKIKFVQDAQANVGFLKVELVAGFVVVLKIVQEWVQFMGLNVLGPIFFGQKCFRFESSSVCDVLTCQSQHGSMIGRQSENWTQKRLRIGERRGFEKIS